MHKIWIRVLVCVLVLSSVFTLLSLRGTNSNSPTAAPVAPPYLKPLPIGAADWHDFWFNVGQWLDDYIHWAAEQVRERIGAFTSNIPEWLQQPIPRAYAGTTFGNTSTGSTTYSSSAQTWGGTSTYGSVGGDCWAFAFTASVSETVSKAGVRAWSTVGGTAATAIYSDSSNYPGALLGYSSAYTLVADQWMDGPLNVGVYLAAGVQYWEVVTAISGSNYANMYLSTTGGNWYYLSTACSTTSWSNPFSAGAYHGSYSVNMRVTYTQIEGYAKFYKYQYGGSTGDSISSFSFYVSTGASGSYRLALYDDNGASPSKPNHLLWSCGSTAASANAWNTVAEASGTRANGWNDTLTNAAWYWFTWQWSTVTVGPSYTAGAANYGAYIQQAYGAFTDPGTSATVSAEQWSQYVTIPVHLLRTINLTLYATPSSVTTTSTTITTTTIQTSNIWTTTESTDTISVTETTETTETTLTTTTTSLITTTTGTTTSLITTTTGTTTSLITTTTGAGGGGGVDAPWLGLILLVGVVFFVVLMVVIRRRRQ